MSEMNWHLSEDRKTARMLLPEHPLAMASFTADELSTLISTLSMVREAMSPEIDPAMLDTGNVRAIGNPIGGLTADEPTNGVLMHVRHPGLGWLYFLFSADRAAEIGDQLSKIAAEQAAKQSQPSTIN